MYADIPVFQEVFSPLAPSGLFNRLDGDPQKGRHCRDRADDQSPPLLGPEAIEPEQPEELSSLACLDYFRIPPHNTLETMMSEICSS